MNGSFREGARKVFLTLRLALAAIAFLGLSNAGLTIWMLTKITNNGERIERSKGELASLVGEAQRTLSQEIVSVEKHVIGLDAALGNPQALQRAALSMENSRKELDDVTQRLRDASASILTLEGNLKGLTSSVEQMRSIIGDPKSGLVLRVENIENDLDLLKGHFGIDEKR